MHSRIKVKEEISMHSRIFQVSSQPIAEDNKIYESRYHDWFVPSIADYVTEVENVKSDLEWLATCKGLEVDVENKTIKITSKKEYFEDQHEQFVELAEKLSNITLDEFISNDRWLDMHNFQSAYEDKYGFYMDGNDKYCGLTTLDSWVRIAEEGKMFYIGSVFDYHF